MGNSQYKQSQKSMMNRPYPKLEHFLLTHIDFDSNIEDYIPISFLKLDLVCIWNFGFNIHGFIWFAMPDSMSLLNSMHREKSLMLSIRCSNRWAYTQFVMNTPIHPS